MSLVVLRSTRTVGSAVLRRPDEIGQCLYASQLAGADAPDAYVDLVLSPEVTLRRTIPPGNIVKLIHGLPVDEARAVASHADSIVVWWGR